MAGQSGGQSARKKTRGRVGTAIWSVLFAVLAGIAVWLAATAIWEARNWNDLKMEEVVFQLTALEGAGRGMIKRYLLSCILPGCVAMAGVGVILFLRPSVLAARVGTLCSLCAIAGLAVYGWNLLEVGDYLANVNTDSEYIERNYADPASVRLEFPEKKRNLIYIWLESMEATYADEAHGGALPQNTIPELTRLAEENTSFTGNRGGVNGGLSLTGSTWTMGGLFGQTAGLPLKVPIADSAMSKQELFFPGIVGLGDILADQGYRQALLIGSDASFAGRRQYFTQHGNYEIWDYPYSKEHGEIPEDYYVWWGYEDEKLFRFAREHLEELAASGQPFNLSILTVDTHFPDGYVCPLCSDEFGADQYANVMACSSRQTAEFVSWVQRQPFYEDTTIVLCGDHITMDVDFCDGVSPDYPRRTYTTIIHPAAEPADPARYREFTTYDMFPTTLAALGVRIEGDRLGLGTNLFSNRPTLLERDGAQRMDQELKRQSEFLNARSGIDPEVYQLSQTFADTVVDLEIEYREDSLVYKLTGLGEIEGQFSRIEVFAEHMDGNTRSSLWYKPAQRQPDGSYEIEMPLSALGDLSKFNIHFYGTTTAGRIKIDTGYVCDTVQRTLVREESSTPAS